MAIATPTDIANQMINQARQEDASLSAEIRTPERLLIDTAAQTIADSQIDLSVLNSQFSFASQVGNNLDNLLNGLFSFGRQVSTPASGFVAFSRNAPATLDITIPSGVRVQANNLAITGATSGSPIALSNQMYTTVGAVTLPAGETSVSVAVQAVTPGTAGNVAANTITTMIDTVPGITAVTNPTAFTNGVDQETDQAYKTRFRNQYFRNETGTTSHYLALATANSNIAKATVVGPISTYQEYIQIPWVDDASDYVSQQGVDYGIGDPAGGSSTRRGLFTTALSTIPYAQAVWSQAPYFISNGAIGLDSVFYRGGVDFGMNTGNARKFGDAYRFAYVTPPVGPDPNVDTEAPNFTFFNVYTGIDPTIVAPRPGDVVLAEYKYMSASSRNSMERNVTNAVDVFVDSKDQTAASTTIPAPTIVNIIVNDPTSVYHVNNYRRIGEPEHRPLVGNAITALYWQPVNSIPNQLAITDPATNATYTYYLGVHYWGVEEVDLLGGSYSSRNGIEWSTNIPGQAPTDPSPNLQPNGSFSGGGPYQGKVATSYPVGTPVEVSNYTYDANISNLQALYDTDKQTTTDVLAHRARNRYFKLDISVVYTPGSSPASVNSGIQQSLNNYFDNQYFGGSVLLSNLLNVTHNTNGVNNVRWSSDVPSTLNIDKVTECDNYGNPLLNVQVDRLWEGTGIAQEVQVITVTGSPTGGYFTLTYDVPGTQTITFLGNATGGSFTLTYKGQTTTPIAWNASASTVQSVLEALDNIGTGNILVSGGSLPNNPVTATFTGTLANDPDAILTATNHLTGNQPDVVINTSGLIPHNALSSQVALGLLQAGAPVSVVGAGTPLDPWIVTFISNGFRPIIEADSSRLTGGPYILNEDFYLQDNQLPSLPAYALPTDSAPGLIVRTRAQSTWEATT